MAKNLIIGGFTNYGINELKPWVLSAKEVAGDNDVVLIAGKTTEETIKWLENQGVIVVPMAMAEILVELVDPCLGQIIAAAMARRIGVEAGQIDDGEFRIEALQLFGGGTDQKLVHEQRMPGEFSDHPH